MNDDAVATFDLETVLRFSEVALAALGAAREEIDALNVYPVPDGDTGTNLFLTFESARNLMLERIEGDPDGDLRVALTGFARGALLGARGNSGVILSQLVGALLKRIGEAGPHDRSALVFAEGLARATEASYAAVGQPVEGTILSVAKAASEAAARAAAVSHNRLGHVIRAAASAARDALDRTPEQLQVLKDAGVVDAGGRGLCVILDAAETAVTGKRPIGSTAPLGARAIPVPLPTGDLTPEGPAYEVMYLLDADDEAIPRLRRALAPLGDSLVVVGGDGLWNVHVHVDDVGAAVEAGIEAGRPYRIRVTHFAEQVERRGGHLAPARTGRKVVVVAAGAGLEELFAQAGASVVPARPGRRPSTGQILEAIRDAGAAEMIVLPNDPDSIAVAEAAAQAVRDEGGTRVAVIPTSAQVQGLAALAVHEPGRTFEEDVLHMTSAARHARSGAVTVAARRAMTTAGPCEPGDVLGVIEGDFVVVGDDLFHVATRVLERLLGGGGELVTFVAGADGTTLAERCASYLAAEHPTVDVVVYDGGQERYPLLVGVE
ncbi:DAK2 domain-containing protein [Nocardioides sp. WL0053]|uniref:DAK2 domain-containing protein n=1 Tax=Nocardioides jiangsuensis TaxID=2866161 RepID=A0ABS7RP98_9ACTN|nr:DAK2 domain-containing protein [Nocardioides jiangsuensis]MBY9075745.1 DAK2 domain-containing protein [Nocardioides jiangsuensis]